MRLFRSLIAQSTLWIVIPLTLIVISILGATAFVYQRLVASLLIDRDRQLAAFSASRISQDLDETASLLQEIARTSGAMTEEGIQSFQVQLPEDASRLFNAGIIVFDLDGAIISFSPPKNNPVPDNLAPEPYFQTFLAQQAPVFSDVLTDIHTGEDMVVILVPVWNQDGELEGGLLGAIHLHTSSLGDPVRNLSVGDEGFAYLVDRQGQVVFHPDRSQIGADFSDRTFIANLISGRSGGLLGEGPDGEPLVLGYAPVAQKGWGLIVREPWEKVIEPAKTYALLAALVALLALSAAALLLWTGVTRLTRPIRSLVFQARRVARAEGLQPFEPSGINEIDELAQAFEQMTKQIYSYRAGLRRYIGSVTQSQEEERRRVARELHDDTIQNLVAILRRVELHQAMESDPAHQASLQGLQKMIEQTIQGVRQLTRALRPLALEDLGLIPALRMLVEEAERANPKLSIVFHLEGAPIAMQPDQELSLYRITQEALSNVGKHAQASNAHVILSFLPESVTLEIEDDGIGFQPPGSLAELAQQGNFGLMGIQERVWAAGGLLQINSQPGEGTTLQVAIPVTNSMEPGAP